ncbi:hypothetical protein HYPSUDRAFT_1005282 [Hypholoma sublateritium FD-334 SS-4]|uniref:Uncharacterized protein n=1 Tax=Hypholoma sublateritium (strain FD-334 SS-4) TaxID=945553 RepID=A0A0D2NM42_HYPSF|nr:hypothetical protein HYPSUDRAFT_1005282 [Hypholoma sublateritium FD-334 SS-4]
MSSPTPPGTPKPAGSRWASRMGAAVRRSSTLLSIARPTTPQTDRDSDTSSLRKSSSREALSSSLTPKVNTAPPPVAAPEVTIPTPIAESPAREAEATQREALGRSPLVQAADTDGAAAPSADPPPAAPVQDLASPVTYVPPPLIDSSAGNPGAFTDILDTIPQPDVVKDPYAATNTGRSVAPSVVEEPQAVVESPQAIVESPQHVATEEPAPEYSPPPVIDSAAGNPGAFTDEPDALPQSVVARDPIIDPVPEPVSAPAVIEEPAVINAAVVETKADPVEVLTPAAPAMDHSESYFDDKPLAESMSDYDPTEPAPTEFAQAIEANVPIVRHDTPEPVEAVAPVAAAAAIAVVAAEEAQHGEAASYYNAAPPMPVPEMQPAPAEEVQGTNGYAAADGTRGMPQPYGNTVPPFGMDYSSPDIWASAEHVKPHEVWATAPDPAPVAVAEESGYHTSLPIQIPVPIRASASVGNGHGSIHSFSSGIKMPNPHGDSPEDPFADPPVLRTQVFPESQEDAQRITMPLIPFAEVIPQPVARMPSAHSSIEHFTIKMPDAGIEYVPVVRTTPD